MKQFFKSYGGVLGIAIAGVCGFFLRSWLFSNGIDEKGLIIVSHPANTLCFLLTALVFAGAFLYARKNRIPNKPIISALGCLLAAAGVLYTGIPLISAHTDTINLLTGIFSIPAGLALCGLAWQYFRGKQGTLILHAAVVVFFMLLPISQYRTLNTEPELPYYFFYLLAWVMLMLAAYHRACLDTDREKATKYYFFTLCAGFCCCMCLLGSNRLFYLCAAIWALTEPFSLPTSALDVKISVPWNVLHLINTLERAGYEAYMVGGCVRDSLLGLQPQDYDLCTSATPDAICKAFADCQLVRSGEKHGTIGVVYNGKLYEITTFRTEGDYSDNRHPDQVAFVDNLTEDLRRRDFTVNAMAYHPLQGLIDPWNGARDLQNGVLRAVGDAKIRFTEDALRILRGMRFAVRFHLTIEKNTQQAMFQLVENMQSLARERVFEELCKLLPAVSAKDLQKFAPVLVGVIPELQATIGFQQHSPHHSYDVFTHTIHVVEAAPKDLALRWAALLHDIEKPAAFTQDENGRGHFYGHADLSAETAEKILIRLKAPNALREQVVFLISQHMTPLEADKKLLLRRLSKYGKENLFSLIQLQKADFFSKGTRNDEAPAFSKIEKLIEEILQESACLGVGDLTITGRDILALGYAAGPQIGKCMTYLLDKVQNEELPNEKEVLLEAADAFLKQA